MVRHSTVHRWQRHNSTIYDKEIVTISKVITIASQSILKILNVSYLIQPQQLKIIVQFESHLLHKKTNLA